MQHVNLNHEEFQYINAKLSLNEKGYAELFLKYSNKYIVCLDIKRGAGYMYDEEKALYIELCKNSLIMDISTVLQNVLTELIEWRRNSQDLSDITQFMKKENEYRKYISNFGTAKTTEAIYKYLMSFYYKPELIGKFDTQQNVLPLKGKKIIQLCDGAVLDRTKDHLFTYEMDFDYMGFDDNVTCKSNKFFMELATDNVDKYNYLQLVFGSAITTDTLMKCFFVLVGALGNNGKSTVVEIVKELFSHLTVTLSPHLLFSDNKDKVDATDYASLVGKTFSTTSEPEDKNCNSEVLKLLTGGDSVKAKILYKDKFEFVPMCKIFILLNNMIYIVDDENKIMMERTRVINFNSKFVANPTHTGEYAVDLDIKRKFTTLPEYRNDMFTWLVNGAIKYLSKGNDRKQALQQPASLEQERTVYFEKMDYFGKFIKESCIIDKNASVTRSKIYEVFEDHQRDNGQKIKDNTKSNLFNYLERKFTMIRPKNVKTYKGLRLKTSQELLVEHSVFACSVEQPTVNESADNEKDKLILELQKKVKLLESQIVALQKEREPETSTPSEIPSEPKLVEIVITTAPTVEVEEETNISMDDLIAMQAKNNEWFINLSEEKLRVMKILDEPSYTKIIAIRNNLINKRNNLESVSSLMQYDDADKLHVFFN